MQPPTRIVVLGLSIASSWGNGHATTYRSLLGALGRSGAEITFLERDVPWYRHNRDFLGATNLRVVFYDSLAELDTRHRQLVKSADVVMVGSYVPDGREVGAWVQKHARGLTAFYDIDTPVTLAALNAETCEYLSTRLLRGYDLYLSFTGGPALDRLATMGARMARPLYCAVDPALHQPVTPEIRWELGYLGTYAEDRQPAVEELLLAVARAHPDKRFVVGGAQYPADVAWTDNVDRHEHVSPRDHSRFYRQQRFTLNVTRREMRKLGYSPSVRLFEAAACGAAIISDVWMGLDEVFTPYREVLPARTRNDVEAYLRWSEEERLAVGAAARARVLSAHTSLHRAHEFLSYVAEASRVAPPPREESSSGKGLPHVRARGSLLEPENP